MGAIGGRIATSALSMFLVRSTMGHAPTHRPRPHDLIYVAVKTAPNLVKSGLRSKLPSDNDRAVAELTSRIQAKIDNDGVMVISADMVPNPPYGVQPGKWGVDEPDPVASSTALQRTP